MHVLDSTLDGGAECLPQDRDAVLTSFCYEGLRRTLNLSTLMFDCQFRNGELESTHGTEALTSTCIGLIGMSRARKSACEMEVDPLAMIEAVAARNRVAGYTGVAGLLLWANALWDGADAITLVERAGLDLGDGRRFCASLTTMEMAWLLSGLLHERNRSASVVIDRLVNVALAELEGRFNRRTRLMDHSGAAAPLRHRLRRRLSNFADQIYAVQAFSFAAIKLDSSASLERAEHLAARLVELQGPLGQWWWHYHSLSGCVTQQHPVYSVHQHAMAPMALMALKAAGGTTHASAIDKSFEWLDHNEVGISVVDVDHQTIWRDIKPANGFARSLTQKALAFFGQGMTPGDHSTFEVNRETRPYEWAWYLYAGAIRAGVSPGRSLA